MERHASVIALRADRAQEYLQLHKEVWPEVLDALKRAHVSNYSIFLRDGLLFSYMEYSGQDFQSDMAAIAEDEPTRRWWTFTDPCQQPLPSAQAGERWVPAEEVFHLD
jgi:L-rhamnose mutarotase